MHILNSIQIALEEEQSNHHLFILYDLIPCMTDFVLKTHLSKNQEVESRLTASEDVFVVSLSHYNKRDTTLHSTKRKKVAYNRSCSDFPLLTERVQLIVSVTVFGASLHPK